MSINLHGATSQKTAIVIFVAERIPKSYKLNFIYDKLSHKKRSGNLQGSYLCACPSVHYSFILFTNSEERVDIRFIICDYKNLCICSCSKNSRSATQLVEWRQWSRSHSYVHARHVRHQGRVCPQGLLKQFPLLRTVVLIRTFESCIIIIIILSNWDMLHIHFRYVTF